MNEPGDGSRTKRLKFAFHFISMTILIAVSGLMGFLFSANNSTSGLLSQSQLWILIFGVCFSHKRLQLFRTAGQGNAQFSAKSRPFEHVAFGLRNRIFAQLASAKASLGRESWPTNTANQSQALLTNRYWNHAYRKNNKQRSSCSLRCAHSFRPQPGQRPVMENRMHGVRTWIFVKTGYWKRVRPLT